MNLFFLSCLALTGCSLTRAGAGRLVLYSGEKGQELFRITDVSNDAVAYCTLPEAQLLYSDLLSSYQALLGQTLLEGDRQEEVREHVRAAVLARLSKVKALGLMAEERGIALDAEDADKAGEAAALYYSSLSEEERAQLSEAGVTQELLTSMFADQALALRTYESVTASIKTEISDDEARIVRVKSILLRTTKENGEAMDAQARAAVYERAGELLRELRSGADYDLLAAEYNEDGQSEYSLGRNSENVSQELIDAAFALDNGELSDVVETPEGYRILLCVSNFERDETESNKTRLLESRRSAAFGKEYDAFAARLDVDYDAELLSGLQGLSGEQETLRFDDCFERVFGEGSAAAVTSA